MATLAGCTIRAVPAQVPSMAELQAAVMVADITGFTKLTEKLSRQGTAGVELLTKCINNYFTRVGPGLSTVL